MLTTRMLLRAVFGLIALLLVANSGSAFVEAWRRYDLAERIVSASALNRDLFEAMQFLRLERGTASTALVSGEHDPETIAAIGSLRSWSAAPLDRALNTAPRLGLGGVDDVVRDLYRRIGDLSVLRSRIDGALSGSTLDQRELAESWVTELGDFVDRLERLAAKLAGTTKRADPVIDQLMTIQQLGWIVRDYAGRDRLAVGNAIAAPDLAATAAWQRQTREYRARVDGAWTVLLDVLSGPGDVPGLKAAIARAKVAYFEECAPVRDRIQAALLAGRPSGYAPREWITFSNPALAALIGVPSAAIELVVQRAAEIRAASKSMLVEQAALAALALLISVLGFVLVTRQVIDPLTELTGVMRRLATGDLTVAVPGTLRRDELGQMAAAVEVFKANAADLVQHGIELDATNTRFAAALDNMSQGLAMFDGEQRLVICNRQYVAVYDLPPDLAVPGTTQADILHGRVARGMYPGTDPQQYVHDRLELAKRHRSSQSVLELPDGRAISVSVQPMPDGGWVSTHEDVTDQRRRDAQIVHMAHHDALTNLPNRARFRFRMVEALVRAGRGERVAVLCLDLDLFKAVNDTLGHPVGDALLCAVSDRLRDCVRELDTVARLGGDEFAILQVGGEQPNAASSLARRAIDAMSKPFEIDGHHVVIGVSVGIALAPVDGTDPTQLLKAADLALYKAKSDGRGKLRFFEAQMDECMQIRRSLELDLRKAMSAGEFELHYQPIVNLGENRVSGFEALLRWKHPRRGMVSPAEFIPLAEEVGLIVPLGEWVLRTACAEAAGWPDGIKIAVNLSPAQFRSPNLLPVVVGALAASGVEATRLELEITESVLLKDDEANLQTLHQIRTLGVRISLDDFGTGYSSLSYLRRFPFDKIKIDKSFVQELSSRTDCAAIVRAIAGLGSTLGMVTTAEGVETDDQLDQLRTEGCTEVQGFLFSKPCPSGEIAGLLERLQPRDSAAA